jgi:hypothetical protein
MLRHVSNQDLNSSGTSNRNYQPTWDTTICDSQKSFVSNAIWQKTTASPVFVFIIIGFRRKGSLKNQSTTF